jgi:hypothetical protein
LSLGCEQEEEEQEEEKKEVLFHAKMAASREPEDVIVSRGGSVLGKKTILKSDHFPGCQNKRLLPHVDGAPNYRQVDVLRILLSICFSADYYCCLFLVCFSLLPDYFLVLLL